MLSSGLRIPLLSLLLLLLAAMELSWSLTDEEKKLIVDQHNLYRSMVSPSAANMRKMSWDSELEAFAKNYSTKCLWEHNEERGNHRGENLFTMGGTLDVKLAVEYWYNEYPYYNYSTLACKPGEMCGHYTQVVWATSERVGCGSTFCDILEVKNETDDVDMHMFVCNYQPSGNIRGRKPYIEGASCSMCPDGYYCKNKLCDSTADEEETTVQPTVPESEATTMLTASPVSTAGIPESPQIVTETGSEPPTTDDQGTTSGSQIGTEAQPIVTGGFDVDLKVPDLQTGTDGIDESLMTTTSATPFVNLIPRSSISPETETEKITSTEHPSSADVLITTQTSLIKTEQPVTILTTTKTPSTPKLPSMPKTPSVPKTPSAPKPPFVPKTPSIPKTPSVPKLPSVLKPYIFPKPPPIPIKRPISKKPARHRLLAYSKAIQSSSNSFQSSAAEQTLHQMWIELVRRTEFSVM